MKRIEIYERKISGVNPKFKATLRVISDDDIARVIKTSNSSEKMYCLGRSMAIHYKTLLVRIKPCDDFEVLYDFREDV